MSEHSLHERVAAAAEERRLSANRLTAYQRAWPKILRFAESARRSGAQQCGVITALRC